MANEPLFNFANSARRYIVVGVLGTIIYYAVLWLLVEIAGVAVIIASGSAFIIVVLSNYFLHYLWTFGSSARHLEALPRFGVMSLVGFWLNLGVMFLGVDYFGFGYLWVQAVAIVLVVTWNFVISIRWIFFRSHRANKAS